MIIVGVTVSSITANTATVSWQTIDAAWVLGDPVDGVLGASGGRGTILGTTLIGADTQIEYGPTASYGQATNLDATLVSSHTQLLTALNAGTTYQFRARSATTGGGGSGYGAGVYGTTTYGATGGTGGAPVYSTNRSFSTLAGVPAAPTGLTATLLSASSVGLAWTDVATNESSYVVERAVGAAGTFSVLIALSANVTAHTDNGLAAGTLYRYRVRATNASGNSPYTAEASATTPVTPAPPAAPTGLTATTVNSSQITLGWTDVATNETAYEVERAPTAGGTWTLRTTLGAGATAYGDAGLVASTPYFYRVRATNIDGPSGYSNTATATTAASGGSGGSDPLYGTAVYGTSVYGAISVDTTPPVISNVASGTPTNTSATITWTTNEAADTQVDYGPTAAYGSTTVLNASLVTTHSQPITGLSAGTLYHYRVKSRDAAGNLATGTDTTFTTAAAPDTTPPSISAVAASGLSTTAATITWTTNENSDSQVDYGLTTGYGTTTTLNTALVTAHNQPLTGLTLNQLYHYRVKSRDASGNLATGTDNTFTTAASDTTPPSISAVAATAVTQTGATISWQTNEASDSQVDYGLTTGYGSSTTLAGALVTTHSQPLTGLTLNQLYHYRVKSRDGAGNLATGTDNTFTTLAAADTTPPIITNVLSSGVTSSTAVISWTTNEGATDQVDYGPTSSYGSSTSVDPTLRTSHGRTLIPLTANQLYHYRVRSMDGAGNPATSGDGTFTTLVASGGGGGTLPAAPASGTQQAGMQILIAFTTRPNETPVWVDVSQWVRACSWQRGRDSQLSSVSAGTAVITLDNRDRRFDPTNAAGPYYGTLKKMRRVKIRPGWQSAGYEEFTGYTEDFPMRWDGPTDALVELSCVDGFGVLALHELNRPFSAASGDVRVHEVLDDAGWTTGAGWLLGSATQSVLGTTTAIGSTGDRLISTADAQLQAATLSNADALGHIQAVEQSEMGLFFMTKEGMARFRSRHELQQLASGSGMATFGENTAGGELLYADAQVNAAGDVLYNRARIGRENTQTVQAWQDDASVADYYARTFSATLLLDSDEPTLGYAQAIVNRYKTPLPVIPTLELDATANPGVLWPTILGRELGEVVTVRHRPPGGGAVLEQKSRIEGIACRYEAGDRPDAAAWGWTWRLSPVGQEGSPWVLGDPVYSVLGSSTGTRLVY